jgi:dihydrofolate reductase
MRKIIVAEFISLDGVVEAPETWHFPYVNEEMYEVMWSLNDTCDTMLLGRVTYEGFAGAFAHAPEDDPVASKMNRPAKVVVSSTAASLTWKNSTLLPAGDVVEQVGKLKAEDGASIVITGSIRLAQTLLRAGLVDELNLLVHPIVLGRGRRLFEDGGTRIPLALVGSRPLSTGVVSAVYRPA